MQRASLRAPLRRPESPSWLALAWARARRAAAATGAVLAAAAAPARAAGREGSKAGRLSAEAPLAPGSHPGRRPWPEFWRGLRDRREPDRSLTDGGTKDDFAGARAHDFGKADGTRRGGNQEDVKL
jgi:hypothetical protein